MFAPPTDSPANCLLSPISVAAVALEKAAPLAFLICSADARL